jgi:type VI secretion system secreted protein VgrG
MPESGIDTLVQTDRFLQIDTSLSPGTLVVRSVRGREAISEMFVVDLELASTDPEIKPASLIAGPVTLSLNFNDNQQRYINGVFNRFASVPTCHDILPRYRARIVPALWFLTRTSNCAIFQNKTTTEIVTEILQKYGVTQFAFRLQSSYPKREYCVQYRETAFNFISRLLEEEGICYFFEHTKDTHKLIFADAPSSHALCPLENEIRWEPWGGESSVFTESHIRDWVRTTEVIAKKWTQADYSFQTPTYHLIDSQPTISSLPGPELEYYDYPGRFAITQDGDQLTRVRMEEEETASDTIAGESNCLAFAAGYKFKLKLVYRANEDATFLLTSVDFGAEQGSLYAGDPSPGAGYYNHFSAVPGQQHFRPCQKTPRPVVHGPQTAFVTGPSGEEMYVDQYGRVKVQFHWDREGKYDDNSSCWIRVAQTIAGKGWGALQLPRVGHEVIIEFLEGDPDRPIITGSVYNADHITPYNLPGEKSKTAFKSLSYPGGNGFNELRFDDKKGSEQVFMHGEKDLDIRIKNDRREWIGRDRHLITQRDKIDQISRDQHSTVQRDLVEQISRDHHQTISGKEAIAITGSQSVSVTGDVIEQFSGNQSTQVTGSVYIKGMQIVVEATSGLTINVGGNFITINSGGIQMQGTMVNINGAGAALPGTAGNLVSPISPLSAAEACDAVSGDKGLNVSGGAAPGALSPNGAGPVSAASDAPWHDPNSPDNKNKKHWIEIELLDQDNKPVPGEPYRVTLPDGTTLAEGTLNEKGQARVEAIDPGSCKVTFPKRDKRTWKPK